MGIIVTVWGIVMMCTGFVHNFAGLCVSRIFLGLFEFVFPSTIACSPKSGRTVTD